MTTVVALRPMATFDPAVPAMIYDSLNDRAFEWSPDKHLSDWLRYPATSASECKVCWDGMILAGWLPLRADPVSEAAPAVSVNDATGNDPDAWAALRRVRTALNQFEPVQKPEVPAFADEAKVLVEAVWRLASRMRVSS